jgi:RHH-type proline utilization regulon transcriptional repressor/proline dehydrogenase/delta 1-pyrroline-5-carboxylate dehydrogenase
MSLLIHEAGKTIPDALGEVREAADYCRYYALRAREDFNPVDLPGPTGERNQLRLCGRGVFACISPWNFPLAIFLGQIVAALAAGNSVIAKPAPQTPRIAWRTRQLIIAAGIPADACHVVPGGPELGAALVKMPGIAGVAFTGSYATARAINLALANKPGPIVPLIAETGGQNALIVDSSALPEQVVDDVITSAFRSAGQRCSALRVLYLPESTADIILTMLAGAMQELRIGDPCLLATDLGPVIDRTAQRKLLAHVERLRAEAREICTVEFDPRAGTGTFVEPQAWEIPSIGWLEGEVFGPILHVVRVPDDDIARVIRDINATGFGLTGGVHSRIESAAKQIERELQVGNLYINRSLIGAVVGVQPFGGEGLSGTGPKAGGPHYLYRFACERVTSNNLTAAGGNASLLIEASK